MIRMLVRIMRTHLDSLIWIHLNRVFCQEISQMEVSGACAKCMKTLYNKTKNLLRKSSKNYPFKQDIIGSNFRILLIRKPARATVQFQDRNKIFTVLANMKVKDSINIRET